MPAQEGGTRFAVFRDVYSGIPLFSPAVSRCYFVRPLSQNRGNLRLGRDSPLYFFGITAITAEPRPRVTKQRGARRRRSPSHPRARETWGKRSEEAVEHLAVDFDREAGAQSPRELLGEIRLLRGIEFVRQIGRGGL